MRQSALPSSGKDTAPQPIVRKNKSQRPSTQNTLSGTPSLVRQHSETGGNEPSKRPRTRQEQEQSSSDEDGDKDMEEVEEEEEEASPTPKWQVC